MSLYFPFRPTVFIHYANFMCVNGRLILSCDLFYGQTLPELAALFHRQKDRLCGELCKEIKAPGQVRGDEDFPIIGLTAFRPVDQSTICRDHRRSGIRHRC
jgi:hypothetical protein